MNKRKSSNEVEDVLKRIVVLKSYPLRCNYITMTRACVCIIYAYTRISLEAIARQMLWGEEKGVFFLARDMWTDLFPFKRNEFLFLRVLGKDFRLGVMNLRIQEPKGSRCIPSSVLRELFRGEKRISKRCFLLNYKKFWKSFEKNSNIERAIVLDNKLKKILRLLKIGSKIQLYSLNISSHSSIGNWVIVLLERG